MTTVVVNRQAEEVCNVLKNKGYDYALDPVVISIIAQIIIAIIRLFVKLYGKKDLLKKINHPGFFGNIIIRRKINSYLTKLDKLYEPGLDTKVHFSLMIIFAKTEEERFTKILKECCK
jgi:hypothetical protein